MHRRAVPPPSARGRATIATICALALVAVVLRQRAASAAHPKTCAASGVSRMWAAGLADEYSAKQQEIRALQAQCDTLSDSQSSSSRHVILFQAQERPNNIPQPFLFIAVRCKSGSLVAMQKNKKTMHDGVYLCTSFCFRSSAYHHCMRPKLHMRATVYYQGHTKGHKANEKANSDKIDKQQQRPHPGIVNRQQQSQGCSAGDVDADRA